MQKFLISGKKSLFQAKNPYFMQKIFISGKIPYFRQKFLISGKKSLFQAKNPYFRQKIFKP
jgi:hypothetical protein